MASAAQPEPYRQNAANGTAQEQRERPGERDQQQVWTEDNMRFMRVAFQQAHEALRRREVPIGCVIVRDGQVVATGYNLTNETRNGTRHAEFQAIDQVLRCAGGDLAAAQFERCCLYVTCEPCIMCAGALSLVGMGEVVFGCANDKFGGCGSIMCIHERGCSDCGSPATLGTPSPLAGQPGGPFRSRGGLYADEAIKLLQEFYLAGNPNAPKPHRPLRKPSWEVDEPQTNAME